MHKNTTIFTSSLFSMNSIVIELENTIIAIDIGITLNELEIIKKFIQDKKKNSIYHIITHGDFDHIVGASLFENQTLIGSVSYDSLECQLTQQEEWEQYYRYNEKLINKPSLISYDYKVTLNQTLVIESVEIGIFSTPGHTKDSIIIYIESLGLLIIGDMLSSCDIPIINDSRENYSNSLNIIKTLYNNKQCTVVPGHGSLIISLSEFNRRLKRDLYYLNELIYKDNDIVSAWMANEGILTEDNIHYHHLNSQRKL